MEKTRTNRCAAAATLLLTVAWAGAGCTLKDQDAPPMTGPSELSLSLTMTATPDLITQDGASQSVIRVVARNADAQPVANVPMYLEMAVNGMATSDFGRLSTQRLITGSDGSATAVYTAPPPPLDLNDPEPFVSFYVTPIGTNVDNQRARMVSIRLIRPTTVEIPGAPFADFTYTPGNPRVGTLVQFNGQASIDPDGSIVKYEWDWGDGEQETGATQNHDFAAARDYQVTLTVTDNSGLKASKTRTIAVSQ